MAQRPALALFGKSPRNFSPARAACARATAACAAARCASSATKIAERYCVPTSTPWSRDHPNRSRDRSHRARGQQVT
jgi:hypothetical protein